MQHSRNRQMHCLVEEVGHRLETDHSQMHNEALHGSLQDQRIAAAARTLTYLFSPEIDLIDNIEHSLEHYDKYQKTRLILRELLSASSSGRLQQEVMQTSQDVVHLQEEIEQLSVAFQRLEAQNKQKEQDIQKYRKIILNLSRAYEEAKHCFTDEIRELKYEIQELRSALQHASKKNRSRSKGKRVRLNVPPKQNGAYTDRSINQRFSASPTKEEYTEKEILESHQPAESVSSSQIPFAHHHTLIQKYQFEKESFLNTIQMLERKIMSLQQELSTLKQISQQSIKALKEKKDQMETELQAKTYKLKQKNAIISQLLDKAQQRFSSVT